MLTKEVPMKVFLHTRIALVALLVLPALGAAASAAEMKSCEEGRRRVSQLEALNVSCETARWVARRFDEKILAGGTWPDEEPMRIGHFRCRARSVGPETYRIRCHRETDEIVRFLWGV
jgi:hypothetical protein